MHFTGKEAADQWYAEEKNYDFTIDSGYNTGSLVSIAALTTNLQARRPKPTISEPKQASVQITLCDGISDMEVGQILSVA